MRGRKWSAPVAAALVVALMAAWSPAAALEIVLKDVASDRIERQRAFVRNQLPLPGTPAIAKLDERLAERGLSKGRAIYIRVFKAESELEVWLQNDRGRFTQLAVYPICHWHGTIGPKLKEGDKQSPEGFYSVGFGQTRLVGRWRKAFNLGYPNAHDRLLDRTGSYILVHGGCSSVGCFAMTDEVQEEIYGLATGAIAGGQERFQVHVFPFRMTEENLARHSGHPWAHTWTDLKPAYDSFERTRIPPRVAVCGVRYQISDGMPGETGGTDRHLPVLKPTLSDAPADLAVVIDSQGRWIAPECRIEDEERLNARAIMAASAVADGFVGWVGGRDTSDVVTSSVRPTGAHGEVARPDTGSRVKLPRSVRRSAGSAGSVSSLLGSQLKVEPIEGGS